MAYHALSDNFAAFFTRLNPSPTFIQRAASHHATVTGLIEDRAGLARSLSPQCFLQGSYRQRTAIYTINDVDIVVLCELWHPGAGNGEGSSSSRHDIFDTIAAPLLADGRYRDKVRYSPQSMCIKVDLGIKLEILPVVYKAGTTDPRAEPFRLFRPETDQWEDGYARYHQQWLSWKNGQAHDNFIPCIKVLKHLRSRFGLGAVSFHLECLLFRLPDHLFAGGPADYIAQVLDYLARIPALVGYPGGFPTDARTQLATLAYYYLLADPNTTFLDFFGGYNPGTSWTDHWSPAAAYNIGQPAGGWSLFASGTDPAVATLSYHVYQRAFSNALVLYKPLSYANGVTGTLADGTATTHALAAMYYPLQADGTLGAPVSSVTLRNGEGAILIKTPIVGASNFVVTGFPSSTTSGAPGSFSVTVKDTGGNIVTGYTGTVHFTSSDLAAILPADYTFTATDAGTHTFGATFRTTGIQSLTATDTTWGVITGTQSGITVNQGVVSQLAITAPSSATAGSVFTVSVTAQDQSGGTVPGYSGTVHFTSTDPAAVLPADYTFVAADTGTHIFNVILKTAGSQTVTVTDTAQASITATGSVSVNPAAASTLSLTGFPSPITAGTVGSVTVMAKDAYGNTATSYTGTVHFTSSDAQAGLPADYTFVAADTGTHIFNVILKTAGSQTVTVTDTAQASITATGSVSVNPAAASTLSLTGFPSPITAGTVGSVTVMAKDAYGNTATSYTGTVHFTSGDPQADLPANYTFTTADRGVHTFSATFKTAGTRTLTATDTSTSSITGKSGGIVVNPAAASTLVVSGFPTSITQGTAGTFTVTAIDAYGNVATGYTGTIHFTSSDPRAKLPADYSFTAADKGVHTFSATFNTVGTQSLTATDMSNSLLDGIETGIVVKKKK
jgi:hypothetical protein